MAADQSTGKHKENEGQLVTCQRRRQGWSARLLLRANRGVSWRRQPPDTMQCVRTRHPEARGQRCAVAQAGERRADRSLGYKIYTTSRPGDPRPYMGASVYGMHDSFGAGMCVADDICLPAATTTAGRPIAAAPRPRQHLSTCSTNSLNER